MGHEETFATDLHDHGASHGHLVRMSDAVGTRLREASLRGRTITVKIRFGDQSVDVAVEIRVGADRGSVAK